MDLEQQLEVLKESDDVDREAIIDDAKQTLTRRKTQAAWGRFATAAKKGPSLKQLADNTSNKQEKSRIILAFSIDGRRGQAWPLQVFRQLTQKITASKGCKNIEERVSWKGLEAKFGAEEAMALIESGRARWREDPKTPGAYECMDTGYVRWTKSMNKTRERACGRSDNLV